MRPVLGMDKKVWIESIQPSENNGIKRPAK